MRLENGGILRVEKNFVDVKLPEDLPEDSADNRMEYRPGTRGSISCRKHSCSQRQKRRLSL